MDSHTAVSPSALPPSFRVVQRCLGALQKFSPTLAGRVGLALCTMPVSTRARVVEKEILGRAEKFAFTSDGYRVQGYRWASSGPTVLLAHGWSASAASHDAVGEALS